MEDTEGVDRRTYKRLVLRIRKTLEREYRRILDERLAAFKEYIEKEAGRRD